MAPDSQPNNASEPLIGGTPAPEPSAPAAPAAPAESVLNPAPAQPAPAAPAAPVTGDQGKKKKSKKLPIIIAACVGGVGIIVGLIVLFVFLANREIDLFKTDAFFIPESNDYKAKYALFKNDGKRITDFEFTSVGGFVNGYSYVRNSDSKAGIIDHNGNMTVEFGEYDEMQAMTGFYAVKKGDTASIILGNGDEIATYDINSIKNGSKTPYIGGTGTPYIIIREDDEYKLYNALGNNLATFKSSSEPIIETSSVRTASSVYYDGHLIILSNKNYKVMKTIDTDIKYVVDDAAYDIRTIIFKEKEGDNKRYAIYNKGQFVELGDKCKSIDYNGDTDKVRNSDRYYVYCNNKDSKKMLIRDNKVTDLEIVSSGTGYYVYDEDHYAYYNSSDKKVDIYVNGDKKETISADSGVTVSYKGYEISRRDDKKATLYDLDGKSIHSVDGFYSSIHGLDKNNNILIYNSDKDRKERYYLAKDNGESLTKGYSSISAYGEYYEALNESDDTGDLLNSKGEVIVSGPYEDFDFYDDNKYVLGDKADDSGSDLIDVRGKKVAATLEGSVNYYDAGYFKATSSDKIRYYTTEGKLIHEYSK